MPIWEKWKEKIHKWLFKRQPEQEVVPEACSSPLAKLVSYEVLVRHSDSRFWSWTERIGGKHSRLSQEKFIPEIEWKDEEIVRHFQSSRPSSCEVLLHYLSPAKQSTANPILLIHGAGHHANLAWCESAQQEKG